MSRLACAAILFDSDGVLVASDESVARAWGEWARHYGLDAHAVLETVHGRLVAETVSSVLPAGDQEEGLRLIIELERADAATCTAIPGSVALLTELGRSGVLPWAIATSGESVLARARLDAAGMPLPEIVVTGDDVTRGKPHPDPYLLAAARLGVAIDRCVVVEDSPAGVAAARAAGAAGVLGVGARAAELDVDAHVPDLRGVSVDAAGILVP